MVLRSRPGRHSKSCPCLLKGHHIKMPNWAEHTLHKTSRIKLTLRGYRCCMRNMLTAPLGKELAADEEVLSSFQIHCLLVCVQKCRGWCTLAVQKISKTKGCRHTLHGRTCLFGFQCRRPAWDLCISCFSQPQARTARHLQSNWVRLPQPWGCMCRHSSRLTSYLSWQVSKP